MDISYFHGREVSEVKTGPAAFAVNQATWVIAFEGGGFILSYDETPDIEAPAVEGLALTTSEVNPNDDVARLYFGTDDNPKGTLVMLRVDEYGLMDEVYSQGDVVRPEHAYGDAGADVASTTTVPAENIGQTPEGPSEEFLAAQGEPEEEPDGA